MSSGVNGVGCVPVVFGIRAAVVMIVMMMTMVMAVMMMVIVTVIVIVVMLQHFKWYQHRSLTHLRYWT